MTDHNPAEYDDEVGDPMERARCYRCRYEFRIDEFVGDMLDIDPFYEPTGRNADLCQPCFETMSLKTQATLEALKEVNDRMLSGHDSLMVLLKDWTEIDFACRAVATSLGVLPPLENGWGGTKGLFWSRHSLGTWTHKILRDLCAAGVLEYREEPDESFRWVQHFPNDGNMNPFGPS